MKWSTTSTGSCRPRSRRDTQGEDPMTTGAARSLRDLRMADFAEVGGKAASLGELLATDVRVPDGVVLTVERGRDCLPTSAIAQIASAAERLGDGPFAVRSSGCRRGRRRAVVCGHVRDGARGRRRRRRCRDRPGSGRAATPNGSAGTRPTTDVTDGGADPANDRACRGRRCAHRRPDRRRPSNVRRHRGPRYGGSARVRRVDRRRVDDP